MPFQEISLLYVAPDVAPAPIEIYPKHSKGVVNRAGIRLAANETTPHDLTVIENWRAAHNHVLNTFQANLRRRAKLSQARSPVQRIKRLETIQNKLVRYPSMQLARMHDIVGCRVVFNNIAELIEFRNEFNRSRFSHRRRFKKNEKGENVDAYNYIISPKDSGYRGIHDVFEYRAKQSGPSKKTGGEIWNGLHIEIQYRTAAQHAWATAVEICDKYTDNHGKFSNAPEDYLHYFQIASELLARHHEGMTGCLPDRESVDLVDEFCRLEEMHGMLRTLRGVQPSDDYFESDKHTLLIFDQKTDLVEVVTFSDFRTAIAEFFKIEREKGDDIDVVLVAADDPESVRFGFKNYFSDAREFVNLVDEACKSLG